MIKSTAESNVQRQEAAQSQGTCGALFILAKPGIVAAVTLSGITGMIVARRGLPDAGTGCACAASLLLMAAGSALANSVLDRSIDEQMARLTLRSAALKRVGIMKASAAAISLTCAALALACIALSGAAALLLVAAALSYTLYYTLFLKRHTPWAAVLGGLPGAFPILVGQAAVSPQGDLASYALFLVMLVWQPPHFWLLSLSHRDEYRAAGVPVLPLVKGEPFTRSCIYAGVAALIPVTLLLSYPGPCSGAYAFFAFLLGLLYLWTCRYSLARGNYRSAFRASVLYLLSLFTIIMADLCLGAL